MSSEEEEESTGLWGSIKSFFKAISLKTKLVIGIIVGVFSFVAFQMFRKTMNDADILELELKKVREEIEIEKAQEEIDINNHKLDALEIRADEIVKEIAEIEKPDPDKEVSDEEIDKFFDDRGF
jgi:predicted negative regulator of RcsB-dependent stress response